MIFAVPDIREKIDQGDIIDECPIVEIVNFDIDTPKAPEVAVTFERVVVLTQTCDLAHGKSHRICAAIIHEAQQLIDRKMLKPDQVRGPIRAGRVFGWYYLPKFEESGLNESIVDLREIHTVPMSALITLCQAGKRIARIQPLYREHLSKHFADTYSRIGLPLPYETE